MNQAKTALLMAALTALLVGVGHIIDIRLQSNVFAFIFLIFGLGTNLVTYWFSDRIIFALYRVRPIQEQQAPALFNMVERLSTRGHSHAKDWHHPSGHTQRLCHGSQPFSCLRLRHRRDNALFAPAGIGGRFGT